TRSCRYSLPLYCYPPHRDLHSFPTRRSSDLQTITRTPADTNRTPERNGIAFDTPEGEDVYDLNIQVADLNALNATLAVIRWKKRSEEHTSELQSPCNLVCRLLLEKKNQQRAR